MVIIGIAGGTGSGKTTIAQKIIEGLPKENIALLSLDAYYKATNNLSHEERSAINFDHPDAIDFTLLEKHLKDLKANKEIAQPIYSFENHNRTNQTLRVKPCKVLLIEGILLFSKASIRESLDIKIYIETADDERLIRRLKRDVKERGRDINEVLSRYQSTLKPMHNTYIAPCKEYADIIIPNNNYNTVATDMIQSMISNKLQ